VPHLRSLESTDALALFTYYDALSSESIRTFRPLGPKTTTQACEEVVRDNVASPPGRFDVVACEQDAIVGWSFVNQLTGDHPYLGVGVADHLQGRGMGTALLRRTLERAKQFGLSTLYLMVVQDNWRAIKWYERHGFETYAEEFEEGDQLAYFHMVARLQVSGENRVAT
jgi:ribosomal protein S18 acetylase RimI-like enzyme